MESRQAWLRKNMEGIYYAKSSLVWYGYCPTALVLSSNPQLFILFEQYPQLSPNSKLNRACYASPCTHMAKIRYTTDEQIFRYSPRKKRVLTGKRASSRRSASIVFFAIAPSLCLLRLDSGVLRPNDRPIFYPWWRRFSTW
jgi:hypothetical protein